MPPPSVSSPRRFCRHSALSSIHSMDEALHDYAFLLILLMDEILHDLEALKCSNSSDFRDLRWCKKSSINSMLWQDVRGTARGGAWGLHRFCQANASAAHFVCRARFPQPCPKTNKTLHGFKAGISKQGSR